MASRRQFFRKAAYTTAAVAVPTALWGCSVSTEVSAGMNLAWEERAAQLEGMGVYTAVAPGPWAEKVGSHVPKVTFNEGEGTMTVFTEHGMAREHWISTIYVRAGGRVIGLKEFTGDDAEARATFQVPAGTTDVVAFSYCSLHDTWHDG